MRCFHPSRNDIFEIVRLADKTVKLTKSNLTRSGGLTPAESRRSCRSRGEEPHACAWVDLSRNRVPPRFFPGNLRSILQRAARSDKNLVRAFPTYPGRNCVHVSPFK